MNAIIKELAIEIKLTLDFIEESKAKEKKYNDDLKKLSSSEETKRQKKLFKKLTK